MAWQVAIVFDEPQLVETLHDNLYILLGQMPVWVVAEADRVPKISELREQWNSCWWPEPALTLVRPSMNQGHVSETFELIPTIQEHHPRMATVRVFGIEPSDQLRGRLADLGFVPTTGKTWDGLGFATPLRTIEDVADIELDATEWKSGDDFYQAFFKAVGAPNWHGKSLDALNDSISTGGINKIEVPCRLLVKNTSSAASQVVEFLGSLTELISNLRANGCPIDLQTN